MSFDFSRKFKTEELSKILVDGGVITFAAQLIKLALNIGSTALLARMLGPQDYGLIAMVLVVTNFLMIFKDFGLSAASIQAEDFDHEKASTFFWINILIGAALMVLTVFLAPVLTRFYGDPRVFTVTVVLSLGFIFGSSSAQHQALLARKLAFLKLSLIDILSLAVGFLVGIICAWNELGYWALVWMQLATLLAGSIAFWVASGWIPGAPLKSAPIRSLLIFGANLSGFNFLNYFCRNFDNLLIGRMFGAELLGLYSRAYSLLLFPIGQIVAPLSAVVVPTLSHLQDKPEQFRKYYLNSLKIVAYISMPLIAAMAVLSSEIIGVVLGKDWMAASPYFTVLAIAAFFQPADSTVGWVLVSRGLGQRLLRWGFIAAPVTLLSFIVGAQWGALGVAIGYAISSILLVAPQFYFTLMGTGISMKDIFGALYRPTLLSLFCALIMELFHIYLYKLLYIEIIGICLMVGAVSFFGAALFWKPIKKDMQGGRELFKLLFSKRSI